MPSILPWWLLTNGSIQLPDIALQRSSGGALTGYTFDGTDFSSLGTPLNLPVTGTQEQSVCGVSASSVVFATGQAGQDFFGMYQHNGESWNAVGSPFSVAMSAPKVARLSATRIALGDATTGLRTYDFNGSTWSQTGNALAGVMPIGASITAFSATRVVIWTGGNLQAYDFDGTDWSAVGSAGTAAGSNDSAITALTSSRVAYLNSTIRTLFAFDFNGSTWSSASSGLILGAGISRASMAAMSASRIAFCDIGVGSLRAFDLTGTTWAQVGNSLASVATAEGNVIGSMSYQVF